MAEALALARRGTALASPNPRVGAVVVQTTSNAPRVVGRGWHRYAERTHAERLALAEAGSAARGATLYLNLEPCCHIGRTPPCTDAILAAGIARVVVAMNDPNPAVNGGGIARLRAAGIPVEVGLCQAEARRLNADFACWIRTGRPRLTLKSALSLDGKIAAPPGASSPSASTTWISSSASRERVQTIRHEHDAILVGIGTVLADDPRLSDRTGLPRRRPLRRCVVDAHLRLPLTSQLVQSAAGDVTVFCLAGEPARRAALETAGLEVVELPADGAGRIRLADLLLFLGGAQCISLLVEGGAQVNGALLAAGAVDRLLLFYAPALLGPGGVPVVRGWSGPLAPARRVTCESIEGDVMVDFELTDPYAS